MNGKSSYWTRKAGWAGERCQTFAAVVTHKSMKQKIFLTFLQLPAEDGIAPNGENIFQKR